MNVNVTNILEISSLDLALWIVGNVTDIRLPEYGSNSTINIQQDIVPLLPKIANRIALMTECYILVVGATPTQSSVRSSTGTDIKAQTEILGRKKDLLYRCIQQLESMRETASRMITGLNEYNKSSHR